MRNTKYRPVTIKKGEHMMDLFNNNIISKKEKKKKSKPSFFDSCDSPQFITYGR